MRDRILILGGAGYLGSVLTEELIKKQTYQVTVVDTFQHGVPSLAHLTHNPSLTIVRGDIFKVGVLDYIKNANFILPLAAYVGEPMCQSLNNIEVQRNNQHAVELVVSFASPEQTIIFPCTNSGYGIGGEEECTEESPLNPLSLYGITKVAAERAVLSHPRGISLRLATLFGMSPRMRLDLLVNDFVYRAVKDRGLILYEPGFRRNFIHVRDAARAFVHAIKGGMSPGVYNVGDWNTNMTKADLCRHISDHVPGFTWSISTSGTDPDKRDYLVSNDKLRRTGFELAYSIHFGIEELRRGFNMPFMGQGYRNA